MKNNLKKYYNNGKLNFTTHDIEISGIIYGKVYVDDKNITVVPKTNHLTGHGVVLSTKIITSTQHHPVTNEIEIEFESKQIKAILKVREN